MLSIYNMLKLDEGIRYISYKDTAGKITVGIGFNMDNPSAKGIWIRNGIPESFYAVYSGTTPLSTNSVNSLFNTCVDNCRVDLESIFSEFLNYPDYIQLALINIMFNMGKPTFSKFFTTISLIKQEKFNEAANHILETEVAKELPIRYNRIAKLLKGDYSGYTS